MGTFWCPQGRLKCISSNRGAFDCPRWSLSLSKGTADNCVVCNFLYWQISVSSLMALLTR